MRHESTKYKIAIEVMKSLKDTPNEKLYINARGKKILQRIISRSVYTSYKYEKNKDWYKQLFYKIWQVFLWLEKSLVYFVGKATNWGTSLTRVIIIGFLIILLFFFLYLNGCQDIIQTLYKTVEITFLAGFTKYSSTDLNNFDQGIMMINMLFGIFWYAIFFPTLLMKINDS